MQAASGMPFSPTLADARTTISHPATTSHRFMTAEQRAKIGIRDELIRVSVGLEPVEQLKIEFSQVLEAIAG
jgi:cystathionine beta-lyase/cystathionine gamma-synthase